MGDICKNHHPLEKMKKHLSSFALTTFLSLVVHAAIAASPSTGLTIYSNAAPGTAKLENYSSAEQVPGYAIVRGERDIQLTARKSKLQWSDVAATIDPSTVVLSSLTSPVGFRVLEQSYVFDTASNDKILNRYIGSEIQVEQVQGDKSATYTGVLLGTNGGLILQDTVGGITTIQHYSAIRFPALPEGLQTKPLLGWNVEADKAGTHRLALSYQASGISWWADYNITLEEGKEATTIDLSSWATIVNYSGMGYKDAAVKLMAGELHKAAPAPRPRKMMAMAATSSAADEGNVTEASFADYHLYTFGSPVTLLSNASKQIAFLPTVYRIPVKRVYEFNTEIGNKVSSRITFVNSAKTGLGMPLPAGKARVNMRNTKDGTLEFIGEDSIDHTPKNEEITLTLGSSSDITGKRVMLAERVNNEQKWAEEDIEITLKNHKAAPVAITVKETMRRSANWKIANHNHAYDKTDAQHLRFDVTVPSESEDKVKYTVRYTW